MNVWQRASVSFAFLGLASLSSASELFPGEQTEQKSFTERLPIRSPTAPTGTEFLQQTAHLPPWERENAIYREIRAGNIPNFLRYLKAVTLTRGKDTIQLNVMPDYLAIGSDYDFVRIPMNRHTAHKLAKELGFTLPTRDIVDAIYKQADVKLPPTPLKPGRGMVSNEYYYKHQLEIQAQMGNPGSVLVAGHKKDVVMSGRLVRMPGRIAIYGWHGQNGIPIQPLCTAHSAEYADYSHGVRFISTVAKLNGRYVSLQSILTDAKLHKIVSSEGTISIAAQS